MLARYSDCDRPPPAPAARKRILWLSRIAARSSECVVGRGVTPQRNATDCVCDRSFVVSVPRATSHMSFIRNYSIVAAERLAEPSHQFALCSFDYFTTRSDAHRGRTVRWQRNALMVNVVFTIPYEQTVVVLLLIRRLLLDDPHYLLILHPLLLRLTSGFCISFFLGNSVPGDQTHCLRLSENLISSSACKIAITEVGGSVV